MKRMNILTFVTAGVVTVFLVALIALSVVKCFDKAIERNNERLDRIESILSEN